MQNLSGTIWISDTERALANLDFDPRQTDLMPAAAMLGYFSARMIYNLTGRRESHLICNDLRTPSKNINLNNFRATHQEIRDARKSRQFRISCQSDKNRRPVFNMNATGFGVLSKNIGDAGRSAICEFRRRITDANHQDASIRFLDLMCYNLGTLGTRGAFRADNQIEASIAALSDAADNVTSAVSEKDTIRDNQAHQQLQDSELPTADPCRPLLRRIAISESTHLGEVCLHLDWYIATLEPHSQNVTAVYAQVLPFIVAYDDATLARMYESLWLTAKKSNYRYAAAAAMLLATSMMNEEGIRDGMSESQRRERILTANDYVYSIGKKRKFTIDWEHIIYRMVKERPSLAQPK